MKIFVSAYAAAPSGSPWNRAAEDALFDGLAGLDLAGLELPFYGRLHANDEAWLIRRLQPEWRFVLTLLPGTMNRLANDQFFGLASANADGRRRALDFAEEARRAIERLHDHFGMPVVSAVALHSAPRARADEALSTREDFISSLNELRGRDWGGAELLIEHCDAVVPEHSPDKGFLQIRDECAAIKHSSGHTPARIMLNWGRSAIETRSPAGPLEHIRRTNEAGLLAGLFFSGATPAHPDYGAWKDSHAPFSTSCSASLLTPAAAKAAMTEAGSLSYLGLKIQPLPASLGVRERLAMISDGLLALKS